MIGSIRILGIAALAAFTAFAARFPLSTAPAAIIVPVTVPVSAAVIAVPATFVFAIDPASIPFVTVPVSACVTAVPATFDAAIAASEAT